MRKLSIALPVAAALLMLTIGACDRKPEGSAANQPSPAESPAATPASTPPSPANATSQPAAIDWSRVQAPADKEVAMTHYTHLARLADAWISSDKGPIRFNFQPPATVADDSGQSAAFSPEAWKGVLDMVRATPGGKSAIRALPSNAHNYGDKLGAVRRNAYFVTIEGNAIVFTFAKPLEGESNG
jgi:hypothetical protein